MDRESYKSEASSWSNTPPCVAESRRDMAASLPYSWEREATIYRGNLRQVGSSVTKETSGWDRGTSR